MILTKAEHDAAPKKTDPSAADGMAMPCTLAVRVIANGVVDVQGKQTARLSLSITPVPCAPGTEGALDLAYWPDALEKIWPLDGAHAQQLRVLSLDDPSAGRGVFTGGAEPGGWAINLGRRLGDGSDIARVRRLWRQAMGGPDAFKALAAAYDGRLGKDTVKDLERPSTVVGSPVRTPDVCGTDRGVVAVELSMERALHILMSLAGSEQETRAVPPDADAKTVRNDLPALTTLLISGTAPAPPADENMPLYLVDVDARLGIPVDDPNREKKRKNKIAELLQTADGAKPSDFLNGKLTLEGIIRARLAEKRALRDLAASQTRADETYAARQQYLTAPDPAKALDALGKRHVGKAHSPGTAAGYYAAPVGPGTVTAPATAAARAALRLASSSSPRPEEELATLAQRRLYTIFAYPSLARLFRFVIDVEVDLQELLGKAASTPRYHDDVNDRDVAYTKEGAAIAIPKKPSNGGDVWYIALSLSLHRTATKVRPEIWCTAKVRWDKPSGKAHFLPCTREEIDARAAGLSMDKLRDAAVAEQIDGMVDLGLGIGSGLTREPRFDMLTLDATASTAADDHFDRVRQQTAMVLGKPDAKDLPPGTLDMGERRRATLRTGGLALIDRWRQDHAIDRQSSAAVQYSAARPVLLDASDLTIGCRLDVGVKSRTDAVGDRRRWHTLMARKLAFAPVGGNAPGDDVSLDALIDGLYPDAQARERGDDGVLSVPTALNRDVAGSKSNCMAFTEEIVGAYRGEPLGLATGVDTHHLAAGDFTMDIVGSLPTNDREAERTPPPCRIGWRYHYALRAVFAGGVCLPLSRALCHYEQSYAQSLALPPTNGVGKSYRRHERIETPQVLLPASALGKPGPGRDEIAYAGRMPSPQAKAMIVRTLKEKKNQAIAKPPSVDEDAEGWGLSRRIVLVPSVALDFATAHGVFDSPRYDFEMQDATLQPRILRDDGARRALDTVARSGEGYTYEWITQASDPLKQEAATEKWASVCVAWKHVRIKSRPRGGLTGVDHHAAWGGFPVFQAEPVSQTIPKEGDEVGRREGTVTDRGVILSRRNDCEERGQLSCGRPADVSSDTWVQDLTWNAAAGPPQGDAVFRLLDASHRDRKPRDPYYPDPAAEKMVVEVRIDGDATPHCTSVAVFQGTAVGPVPLGYPDAFPLALDLKRVAERGRHPVVEVAPGDHAFDASGDVTASGAFGRLAHAAGLASTARIPVRSVVIRLQPGEQARIRIWCLPSLVFLKRMFEGTETIAALAIACACLPKGLVASGAHQDAACRTGLMTICGLALPESEHPHAAHGPGPGGLPAGTDATLDAIAKALIQHMETRPVPEIAAPLELTAVHAIDNPLKAPSLKSVNSASWALLRTDASRLDAMLGDGKTLDAKDRELYDHQASWLELENQRAGATGLLLGGYLDVHRPSTGAVEIRAIGAAASRGTFDDPERGRGRDDRARGLWPKPDGVKDADPLNLYGFKPGSNGLVNLKRDTVTLLRIDSFDATPGPLDLLGLQRAARAAAAARLVGKEATSDAARAQQGAIADGRARWIELHAVAIARHGALLTTRYGETAEKLVHSDGPTPLARQWLPATVRPARIAALSIIPSFRWDPGQKADARDLLEVTSTRRCFVRVRMKRPWFSSGEDERVGIVLWPPNIFAAGAVNGTDPDKVQPLAPELRSRVDLANLPPDGGASDWQQLQDGDLGPGGGFVSRWGADPIKVDNEIKGWLLTQAHFDGLAERAEGDWAADPASGPGDAVGVGRALMPLPASEDAGARQDAIPAGGFMSVGLAVFRPRFDPVEEHWFADIEIKPQSALEPFVRLGLARYQPHAPSSLRLSEPIAEWTKLLPRRKMAARRSDAPTTPGKGSRHVRIEASLCGPAQETLTIGDATLKAPRVTMTLLRDTGDGVQRIVGRRENEATALRTAPAELTWAFVFDDAFEIDVADFDDPASKWSVHIEEVDLLRPASYPDEPRYKTREDDAFAPTGPRFMGLLSLDGLKKPARRRARNR